MPLTLGMTGMDPATEAALAAAFKQANAQSGQHWQLLPEADADYVVVDMDSMYGPMSWLRLHAAGKRVVGLSSASRTQTDFHLARPFDAGSVGKLLQSIVTAGGAGAEAPAATPSPVRKPAAAAPEKATPAGMSPAPEPQDQLPEEVTRPPDEEAKAPAPAPGLPGSVEAGSLTPPSIEPPAPPRKRGLVDWLAPGALQGRVRFQPAGAQPLLIDADARQYHGPGALKPLTGYFEGSVEREAFTPVDAATWTSESPVLGVAQPLNRLQWYGGLLAGKGALLPGFDPDGRYQLSKWPQTEREFPKHFRIATAMMKGPATLDEIAAAIGVPRADVVDFVNASLTTGYAEFVPEPPPEPSEPAKTGGLFGRLRGR